MAKKLPKNLPVREDLVEQLRRSIATRSEPSDELMAEAADEIKRLKDGWDKAEAWRLAEVERLEGELRNERVRVDFYRGEIERLESEVETLRNSRNELQAQLDVTKYQGQDK